MTDIATIVFGVACLLAAFSVLLPIARMFNLPHTVALALFGIFLGSILIAVGGSAQMPGNVLRAMEYLRLPSDGYLYVFLPPLLFAAGLGIDLRRLMDEIGPVIILAVVAVLICTIVVGLAVSLVSDVSLVVCLLLGAIVATTDSAAVLAIFRDLGAPKRLLVLVEGESLFNDAAAIAFFSVLFSMIAGTSSPSLGEGIYTFLKGLIGGGLVGYIFARGFTVAIAGMRDAVLAEVTLSVALAYITFYVAEANFGVSGVIAVVSASMTFASFGRTSLSPGAWDLLSGTWRLLDFWATSLIFVLAAMIVPQAFLAYQPGDLAIVLVTFLATLIARYIGLYGLMPLLTATGIAEPVPGDYKKVILWGGLRGAVTIALALAVSESPLIPTEIGRFILVSATGYVLATLLVQAPTLRTLMRFLRMDMLTPSEQRIKARVLEVSQRRVKDQVAQIARELDLERSDRTLSASILPEPVPEDSAAPQMSDKDRLQVAVLAVASRENEIYFEYLQKGLVSRRILQILIAHSGRMIDGAISSGVEGYQKAAIAGLRWRWPLRLALWVQRRFGMEVELSRLLAERFEALLMEEIAIRELLGFSNSTIQELIGENPVLDICQALEVRLATLIGALEAVELQFPDFAHALYQRYLDRAALGFEESQYHRQLAQSVISPEVYEELERERRARHKALEVRPSLNLGLELSRMLAAVPAFSELDEATLSKVARQLRPRLGLPGERIIAEGKTGRKMFFIASGAVQVHLPSGPIRLTKGDFVGEMALMTDQPRNADVVVDGFCHLLVLDRRDFQRLIRNLPELKSQIEAKVAERLQAREDRRNA
ncbi:MAG: cyclic nucleotide-binding domain-containing protein [Alphaproteobacteria bacterium]|nr:MAG: cyclic nucleotide-binding domain-containing protein [Alphaproteobacteria bacterium]